MATAECTVTGIVLAGGLSTRFGTDKSRAAWRGRELVEHVLARLPDERTETLVVLREEQSAGDWPGVRLVHDDPELGAGPLRGVIAGLAACTTDWAWIVACDQPLIEANLLRGLRADARPGCLAVVPVWQGRLQPLHALYATDGLDHLRARAAAGEQSLIAALTAGKLQVFDETACRALDPSGRAFVNVNRPEVLSELDHIAPEDAP